MLKCRIDEPEENKRNSTTISNSRRARSLWMGRANSNKHNQNKTTHKTVATEPATQAKQIGSSVNMSMR